MSNINKAKVISSRPDLSVIRNWNSRLNAFNLFVILLSSCFIFVTLSCKPPSTPEVRKTRVPSNIFTLLDEVIAFKTHGEKGVRFEAELDISELRKRVDSLGDVFLLSYAHQNLEVIPHSRSADKITATLETSKQYLIYAKPVGRLLETYKLICKFRKIGPQIDSVLPGFMPNLCPLILCSPDFFRGRELFDKYPKLQQFRKQLDIDDMLLGGWDGSALPINICDRCRGYRSTVEMLSCEIISSQVSNYSCSKHGSWSLFVAGFEGDVVGSSPAPASPLHYGPPGASFDIDEGTNSVEVVNSIALGSQALRLKRIASGLGKPSYIHAVVGIIDNAPNGSGIYYFNFRAHGEVIPEDFIAGVTIAILSQEDKFALSLKLYDGVYYLREGNTYVPLNGAYDPSVPHSVHIKLDLDARNYSICINDEWVVSDKALMDANFGNLQSLRFFVPGTVTEALEMVYVVDDIRISK